VSGLFGGGVITRPMESVDQIYNRGLDDIFITRRLKQAGRIMCIELLNHLITYISLKEKMAYLKIKKSKGKNGENKETKGIK
jgi:hypothetical protein